MDLDEFRKKIDLIDSQLIELFEARMKAVQSVAEIKKEQGMTIFDPARERDIIEKVQKSVEPEYAYYALDFYNNLLELSKKRQREIISSDFVNDYFKEICSGVCDQIPEPRIAVQGTNGSYAMSAALMMYPDSKLSFVSKWEDVLYSIEDGSVDYGVLPVENSFAGSVTEVYDLLIKHKQYIVKALPVPVDHYLLGIRGAKLNDVKNVYSHAHAFPQCANFLDKHFHLQKISSPNTAVAAEFVAKSGNKENAAIASKDCAHIYGLDILAKSIQQDDRNTTRFISVSRIPEFSSGANKISIVFTLPHMTGSLYRTLARFALSCLNLTKIESRPNPDKNFEYYFYLDFTGSLKSPNILSLLSSLKDELPTFNFLGNYNEP